MIHQARSSGRCSRSSALPLPFVLWLARHVSFVRVVRLRLELPRTLPPPIRSPHLTCAHTRTCARAPRARVCVHVCGGCTAQTARRPRASRSGEREGEKERESRRRSGLLRIDLTCGCVVVVSGLVVAARAPTALRVRLGVVSHSGSARARCWRTGRARTTCAPSSRGCSRTTPRCAPRSTASTRPKPSSWPPSAPRRSERCARAPRRRGAWLLFLVGWVCGWLVVVLSRRQCCCWLGLCLGCVGGGCCWWLL